MNEPTNAQQDAITARGNVIVAAGAGTGKTGTLVQRCLALLEEGCSLENILMVTFTDAAAAEMRRRIRDELQERVRALERRIAAGAADLAPLRNQFEKQLALLDTAPISTLHSFCLRLVREHFDELTIDPEVIVLDEQQIQPLIGATLDAMFERHFAGQTAGARAVQALVRVHGRGSDLRIRALVLKLHRYLQARPDPSRWLEAQLALFRHTAPDHWRAWFVEGFAAWREPWLAALRPHAGNPAVARAIAALEHTPRTPTLAPIATALTEIVAADADPANWPRGSKKNVRRPLEDFFAETEFLRSLISTPDSDPLADDWEWVRHHMIALLELAGEFGAEFGRAKREWGGVDFADLEQFALRVLRDSSDGGVTSTARSWRQQFEHVFVDEYQDINAAQDAILTALSRDGAGGNRFLVGDTKQSIYRFRLGDPGLFRGYEERWSHGAPNARRVPLAHNFRSRGGVLDFVNALFEALMRKEIGGVAYERLLFGTPKERAALAGRPGERPRVSFLMIARAHAPNAGGREGGDSREDGAPDPADLLATEREARLVALRLRELHRTEHEIWDRVKNAFRPAQWSDMVVLLRSPADRVEAFAHEFDRLGIPLEAARGGFFDALEVSDLICLLKLIDNPIQDIPLLAVLRSPLVGLSLDELAEIRAQNGEPTFWLALRRFHRETAGAASGPAAGAAGWSKVDVFLSQLGGWRKLIRQTSLTHCLETTLADTHYSEFLLATPRGEQRAANVRRLLELARQFDPYQRQGLFRFLRFVETQPDVDLDPALAPKANAVRLMSIHASKGLEFPVVALAGLGWQFNLRDLREDILLDDTYGLCPKVAPPGGVQHYPSLPFWLARRRQRAELLGEELRLLYVAMTRACDTLILTATSARKDDPPWNPTDPRNLTDAEILSARCFLDWLTLWLPLVTRPSDWTGEREGQTALLTWKIYQADDPVFAADAGNPDEAAPAVPEPAPTAAELSALRARVEGRYRHEAAAREPAKTSVTRLRRRLRDETDDEAGSLIPLSGRASPRPSPAGAGTGGPTAAERGIAHHTLLQTVDLDRLGSLRELKAEAERLRIDGVLTAEETRSIDFGAVAAFWKSEVGKQILDRRDCVHREVPFTARFTPEELAALELMPDAAGLDGEFFVVQGYVDLAVILPEEIWLVDFKTDALRGSELDAKRADYGRQLRLYGLALQRIYRRPVTALWLHFLTLGSTVPVAADVK